MATDDLTVADVTSACGLDRFVVIENEVDLGANATPTGEVIQCVTVPAGHYVINVACEITEAMGLVATATVGDGAGADSWDASINLNATAGTYTVGAGGTDTYVTAGKFYSAADTIDLTCTIAAGPASAGKVRVVVLAVDCTDQSS